MSIPIVGETPTPSQASQLLEHPLLSRLQWEFKRTGCHHNLTPVQLVFLYFTAELTEHEKHDVLTAAVRGGDVSTVKFLLARNVSPFEDDVVIAIDLNARGLLDEFFRHDPTLINRSVSASFPPFLAKAVHDLDFVMWFLRRGADPNARCLFDITPLSIACQSADIAVIKALFAHGASAAKGSPLHWAVRRTPPDFDVIQEILAQGADINEIMFANHPPSFYHWQDFGLGTALHGAADTGNVSLVEFLLRKGAKKRLRDSCGKLPLDRAVSRGHKDVQVLLSRDLSRL
ncbi:hypothetical protein DV735_g5129, partial [Chaetothyriales sp. CBS 134920]